MPLRADAVDVRKGADGFRRNAGNCRSAMKVLIKGIGISIPLSASRGIRTARFLTDTGIRYRTMFMIRSFGDAPTEALFRDQFVRDFQGIARPAKRRLEAINAAHRLEDLLVPPSNRLEKLKGNLKGFFSIRINDQWRVIFQWIDGDAYEVRVVDYH
jgi:proteic killer suppression protein